ncbi:MAG: patatin-like phospholipase family protein [Christensenellaceae bacterium]|jgi:NTE family protein|nr:patatin-like phospholipase family protein [Christensenellaceae bacterium]
MKRSSRFNGLNLADNIILRKSARIIQENKLFVKAQAFLYNMEMGLFQNKKKVGIVFGGGGARGFAHLGAIKAFYDNGIKFDAVAGTSVGSIAAMYYSLQMPYAELYNTVKKWGARDLFSSKVFFVPSDPKVLEGTLHEALGERDTFAACKMPTAFLSVDITTGHDEVFKTTDGQFDKKPAIKTANKEGAAANGEEVLPSFAMSASCAVPIVFSPVQLGHKKLMDGGLSSTIPAYLLKEMGCDEIVCVDVSGADDIKTKGNGVFEVLSASIQILIKSTAKSGKYESDVIIRPDVQGHGLTQVSNMDELIEAGYKATMEKIAEIRKLF